MRTSRVRPERKGWDEVVYQQHVVRLKKMTSTIDASPPIKPPISNKRELEKKRRFMNIEYDNKLLLERLAKVVQTKSIDNEIHESIDMHAKFKKKMLLNRKRMDMQKLTDENYRMLRRIQEVSPAYNHLQWEEDAKRNEQIKRCMALYPEYYEKNPNNPNNPNNSSKKANSLSSTGALATYKSSGNLSNSGNNFRDSQNLFSNTRPSYS